MKNAIINPIAAELAAIKAACSFKTETSFAILPEDKIPEETKQALTALVNKAQKALDETYTLKLKKDDDMSSKKYNMVAKSDNVITLPTPEEKIKCGIDVAALEEKEREISFYNKSINEFAKANDRTVTSVKDNRNNFVGRYNKSVQERRKKENIELAKELKSVARQIKNGKTVFANDLGKLKASHEQYLELGGIAQTITAGNDGFVFTIVKPKWTLSATKVANDEAKKLASKIHDEIVNSNDREQTVTDVCGYYKTAAGIIKVDKANNEFVIANSKKRFESDRLRAFNNKVILTVSEDEKKAAKHKERRYMPRINAVAAAISKAERLLGWIDTRLRKQQEKENKMLTTIKETAKAQLGFNPERDKAINEYLAKVNLENIKGLKGKVLSVRCVDDHWICDMIAYNPDEGIVIIEGITNEKGEKVYKPITKSPRMMAALAVQYKVKSLLTDMKIWHEVRSASVRQLWLHNEFERRVIVFEEYEDAIKERSSLAYYKAKKAEYENTHDPELAKLIEQMNTERCIETVQKYHTEIVTTDDGITIEKMTNKKDNKSTHELIEEEMAAKDLLHLFDFSQEEIMEKIASTVSHSVKLALYDDSELVKFITNPDIREKYEAAKKAAINEIALRVAQTKVSKYGIATGDYVLINDALKDNKIKIKSIVGGVVETTATQYFEMMIEQVVKEHKEAYAKLLTMNAKPGDIVSRAKSSMKQAVYNSYLRRKTAFDVFDEANNPLYIEEMLGNSGGANHYGTPKMKEADDIYNNLYSAALIAISRYCDLGAKEFTFEPHMISVIMQAINVEINALLRPNDVDKRFVATMNYRIKKYINDDAKIDCHTKLPDQAMLELEDYFGMFTHRTGNKPVLNQDDEGYFVSIESGRINADAMEIAFAYGDDSDSTEAVFLEQETAVKIDGVDYNLLNINDAGYSGEINIDSRLYNQIDARIDNIRTPFDLFDEPGDGAAKNKYGLTKKQIDVLKAVFKAAKKYRGYKDERKAERGDDNIRKVANSVALNSMVAKMIKDAVFILGLAKKTDDYSVIKKEVQKINMIFSDTISKNEAVIRFFAERNHDIISAAKLQEIKNKKMNQKKA